MQNKVEVEVERKIKTTTLNIKIIYIYCVCDVHDFLSLKTMPTGGLHGSKSPFSFSLFCSPLAKREKPMGTLGPVQTPNFS